MKSSKFIKHITVSDEDLDDLKHVNNVVFLTWVQDISRDHWFHLSDQAINEKYYWVVLNHFIEYKGQAKEGELLEVETYVEKMQGVRSKRVVTFSKHGKLIVKAKTEWCLMDRKTNRPSRIPPEFDRMFMDEQEET